MLKTITLPTPRFCCEDGGGWFTADQIWYGRSRTGEEGWYGPNKFHALVDGTTVDEMTDEQRDAVCLVHLLLRQTTRLLLDQ